MVLPGPELDVARCERFGLEGSGLLLRYRCEPLRPSVPNADVRNARKRKNKKKKSQGLRKRLRKKATRASAGDGTGNLMAE